MKTMRLVARLGTSTRVRATLTISPTVLQSLELLACGATDLHGKVDAAAVEHPALELTDSGGPLPRWMSDRDGPRHSDRSERTERSDDVLLSHAGPQPGLHETLVSQLRLIRLDADDRRLAIAIVASLDDDGYLRATPDDVVTLAGVPAATTRFESVLARVQALDPPGVAARDLAECLLLQLREHDGAPALLASRIVRDHLSLLARGRLASLAAMLSVELRLVQDAARLIARLDPAPGRAFGGEPPRPRIPDVAVVQVGGRWAVRLCDDAVARLRMPAAWTRPAPDVPEEVRGFLDEQAERAAAFLRRLEHRRETLLRVAESIVDRQQAFFSQGPGALRPLTLRDVADDVGVAVSTVSRAVAGKTADTPQGLVPLKRFFPTAGRGVATSLTVDQVRARIAALVASEDPAVPFSDGQLAEGLGAAGIRVTRRTVANHRGALGIAPAPERRRPASAGPPGT